MAASDYSAVTLRASCLCRANAFDATIPEQRLPLRAHVCHCTSCRHVSGALYTANLRWPEPRENLDLSKLKTFGFSYHLDLLFCPTCSTPMFWAWPHEQTHLLGVWTGTLADDRHDLIEYIDQSFVADTLDGGASVWLRHPNTNGSEMKRFDISSYSEDAKELPQKWPSMSEFTEYLSKEQDIIPVRCKCKGVDFVVNRGDYSAKGEDELPWNIEPETRKLLTSFCGCISCRRQSGVDIFNWAFIDMKHISFSNSVKSFPTHSDDLKELVDVRDPTIGTLRYYASSPEVQRFFCGNCSACIFYTHGKRPTFAGVAVGVLEASDGARAEGLLSWDFGGRMACQDGGASGDDSRLQRLFERVQEDGEKYRVERGYPKTQKRLEVDNAAMKDADGIRKAMRR